MAGNYQYFLSNAQDASSEAGSDVSQVGQMLSAVNGAEYLPGCGINVSQALNLLQQATNLARTAASNVSSAFAAAGCPIPPNVQALLNEATAAPLWESTGGAAFGTVYVSGQGAGVCLDTQTYLPSVERIVSAAEQAVAAAPAAIATCLGLKTTPREGAPVRHVGPTLATNSGVPRNEPVMLRARRVGQVPTVSSSSASSPSTSGVVLESAVGLGMLGLLFGSIVGLVSRQPVGESAAMGGIVGALIGATGGVVYANQQAAANSTASSTSSSSTAGG